MANLLIDNICIHLNYNTKDTIFLQHFHNKSHVISYY